MIQQAYNHLSRLLLLNNTTEGVTLFGQIKEYRSQTGGFLVA